MNRKMEQVLGEEAFEDENPTLSSETKEKKLKKEIKKTKLEELASVLGEKKSDLKDKRFSEIYSSVIFSTKQKVEIFDENYENLKQDLRKTKFDFEVLQEKLKNIFKIYENIHKSVLKYRKIFKNTDHASEMHEFGDLIMLPLNSKVLDILIMVANLYKKDQIFGELDFLGKKDKKNETNIEQILEKIKYFSEKISKKYLIEGGKNYIVNKAIELYNSFEQKDVLTHQYFEDLYNENMGIENSKKNKTKKTQNGKKTKKS